MDELINIAISKKAWNPRAAQINLERWLSICEKEKWDISTPQLEALALVFGASWYFTRFIYFQGPQSLPFLNQATDFQSYFDTLLGEIEQCKTQQLEALCIKKNQIMLLVLVHYLYGNITQEKMETTLTHVANAVIKVMLALFKLDAYNHEGILVLGMGRLAVYEMNYGSDLDLIFLATGEARLFENVVGKIRKCIRTIAQHMPAGSLYDIDMRLRPHGNSGTLITSLKQFIHFHQDQREIWERQMMTRHRTIYGMQTLQQDFESAINPAIYKPYRQHDLLHHIPEMRMCIEKELGRVKGRFDIKRGYGGIMDIDFLTHYFQLHYGQHEPSLQGKGTRAVLRRIGTLRLMEMEKIDQLLQGYDYLKRVECVLRVFDMKPISQFSINSESTLTLAKAMGHNAESNQDRIDAFIEEYRGVTNRIRAIFKHTLSLSA